MIKPGMGICALQPTRYFTLQVSGSPKCLLKGYVLQLAMDEIQDIRFHDRRSLCFVILMGIAGKP